MNLVAVVQGAVSGWLDMVAGRASWRERFDLTVAGLINAVVIYGFIALSCIFATQMQHGLPSPIVLLVGLLVMCLPLVALTVAIYLTRAILQFEAKPLDIIVPGIFVLAVYLMLGTALAAIGPMLSPALLLGVGGLLFRQGMIAANLSLTNSIAFAILTVVLLVALPSSLYMLLVTGNGPI